MQNEKLDFITSTQFLLLNKLRADDLPKWGVMNAQQMTEHVRDFFQHLFRENKGGTNNTGGAPAKVPGFFIQR